MCAEAELECSEVDEADVMLWAGAPWVVAEGAEVGVSVLAAVNPSRETGEVLVPVEDIAGEPCGVSAVAMDMVLALMMMKAKMWADEWVYICTILVCGLRSTNVASANARG